VLLGQGPKVRGLQEPYRSPLWAALGRIRIVGVLEQALGQFVVSKRASRDMTGQGTHEYEAFRTRDLSGYEVAYRFIDTVYEPIRHWGSQTGVLCG
jgi:hypothetical protein